MKKYIFLLIATLLACTVAIAQPDDGSKRPKKKKQKTEKVVKKDHSKHNQSGKKPKAPNKQYSEEPRVSSSYTPEVRTYYANGVSFQMVEVRGGTFTMGATAEQGSDVDSDEKPTHQVTLSSYSIGKTEVTQALWQAVMGKSVSQIASENGWNTYGVGLNYPMYDVSWEDCQAFITKLNALTGKNFRLPTEAEWEFAARGGNNSRGYKYSGSNTLSNVAWYTDSNTLSNVAWYIDYSSSTTHPVATKASNELGIYDMSGNVWEWCSDWKGSYSSSSQYNPTGPNSGSLRVFRGGCWFSRARLCRVSDRNYDYPASRDHFLGLRLAL